MNRWLGLVMLLCLVPPAFAGVWHDDFEDGDLHGWEIFNYDPRVEKWWVKRGEAIGEIAELGSMSLLVAGESDWRDYRVRCRAKFDKTFNDEGSLGISLYESEDGDSRYLFFIEFADQRLSLWRVAQGDWGFPVVTPFQVERDRWYPIQATVQQDQLFFQVEDTMLAAVVREPLSPGKFALVVSNARAHFDDVFVEGESIPNGGPAGFAVAPQGKLSLRWADLKHPAPSSSPY